jgi:dTMP kinase
LPLARGRFITLEGGEGAGKSTQTRRLQERLQSAGHEVVVTREPGGSEGAEEVRNLLVSGSVDRWDAVSEAMLHFVARRDHLLRLIEPALAKGIWVISDRFTDSTIAYQGYGQGGDLTVLDAVRRIAIGDFDPDMTLLLDLAPEDGLARAASRDNEASRYDRMGLAMHERLRAGFLALAAAQPERIAVVDASSAEDDVADRIWALVRERYGLSGST